MRKIKNLVILTLIVLGFSCEENNNIVDEIIDDDIIGSTELNFHNPSSIALVKAKEASKKKSSVFEEGKDYYYIYEIANDSFKVVNSKDGHEVYFSGIGGILKINQDWQLISRMHQINSKQFTIYKVYNDTTITYNTDEILLNIKTGDLYEIDLMLDFGIHDTYRSEPFHYDSLTNSLYLRGEFPNPPFCRINLNNLSEEVFDLPFKMSPTDFWCVIDNMIFYTSSWDGVPKFLCYKPNVGYITNTNFENYSIDHKLRYGFQGKNGFYFGTYTESPEEDSKFLKLFIRNDSMIFESITPNIISSSNSELELEYALNRQLKPINNGNQTWYFIRFLLWTFDDTNNTLYAIELENNPSKVISDGFKHYGLVGDVIYRYDLDALRTSEFISINTTNLQIEDVFIGYESNLFVEGWRLSDFKNVVIEYDGITGEKISETISEEALPQSFITYLSPI